MVDARTGAVIGGELPFCETSRLEGEEEENSALDGAELAENCGFVGVGGVLTI